jgi:hypothetical protein
MILKISFGIFICWLWEMHFYCWKIWHEVFVQPMFLKCYHHLHHVVDCEIESIDHKFYENCNLNMFEMIVNTSELIKELVNRDLLIFKRFWMDPKEIKCPFQWWQKRESMSRTIDFFAWQILGIVGSQIKTKMVFSLTGIFTKL